jgi:hypothetical protein
VQVKNIIHGNRQPTLRICRRDWNIHWFMPHDLLEDLGILQISAEFLPRLLTVEQKLQRLSSCENPQQKVYDE